MTKKHWQAILWRAVRTTAQCVIASIGGTTINYVDWVGAGYFTATMVILSISFSILKPPAEAEDKQ